MQGEYKTVLSYLDTVLVANAYVAGADFTAADIMVSYTLELASGAAIPMMKSHAPLDQYPAISAFMTRVSQRPAYIKARKLCAP